MTKVHFVSVEEDRPDEIYSYGLEYSFLDKNLMGMHIPVYCKDFLTDIIWSDKLNVKDDIYNFSVNGKVKFLGDDFLTIAIRDLNADISKKKKNLQNILNLLEGILEFNLSEVLVSKDATEGVSCLIIKFDKQWTKYPYLFSMFTLFLRIGLNYEGQKLSDFLNSVVKDRKNYRMEDLSYVKSAKDKILKIVKGYLPEQKYEDYKSIDSIHNKSGIVNFIFPEIKVASVS